LVRLLRNLLVLTDLETGRRQLQLQPQDLRLWLQGWSEQQQLPEGAGLHVEAAPDGDALMLAFDGEALAEVLAQLLDNSLRYCNPPASITLQLQCTDDAVELLWQDAGLGIAAQPREQVFERFVRLEEHRHHSQADGAGLGLALAAALMQAMGGAITLAQPAESQPGTTFVMRWPQD